MPNLFRHLTIQVTEITDVYYASGMLKRVQHDFYLKIYVYNRR